MRYRKFLRSYSGKKNGFYRCRLSAIESFERSSYAGGLEIGSGGVFSQLNGAISLRRDDAIWSCTFHEWCVNELRMKSPSKETAEPKGDRARRAEGAREVIL